MEAGPNAQGGQSAGGDASNLNAAGKAFSCLFCLRLPSSPVHARRYALCGMPMVPSADPSTRSGRMLCWSLTRYLHNPLFLRAPDAEIFLAICYLHRAPRRATIFEPGDRWRAGAPPLLLPREDPRTPPGIKDTTRKRRAPTTHRHTQRSLTRDASCTRGAPAGSAHPRRPASTRRGPTAVRAACCPPPAPPPPRPSTPSP